MKKNLQGLCFSVVYALLYIPLLLLVYHSFNQAVYGVTWQGFTLQWYVELWRNDALLGAAMHSMILAVCAAGLSTALGFFSAIVFYRYRFFGQTLLKTGLFVAMLAPDIVMALSLLAFFLLLRLQLGFLSLLIAHITFCLPFSVTILTTRLKDIDKTLLEAARDLGASEGTIIFKILLPLLLPAVGASGLLTLMLSMDDVVISSFVSGAHYELLPLKIQSMVRVGVSPAVNALTTLMLFGNLLLVFALQWVIGDKPLFKQAGFSGALQAGSQ